VGIHPSRVLICLGSPPAPGTVQIVVMPPSRSEENAIREPSCDHDGSRSSNGPLVMALASPPSRGIT